MSRTISRDEVFELLSATRLSCRPAGIADFLEDYHQDPERPEVALPLALSDHYLGVQNGHLSEIYEAITGERVEVVGDAGTLLECPCCGYRTLGERFDAEAGTGFDVCRYCGWEDDGTSNPESRSSANKGSMAEYRQRMSERGNFFARDRWERKCEDSEAAPMPRSE
jgi:hypothetical protein